MSPPRAALDDPDRLQALQETGLLDESFEEAYDRLTRLAGRLLKAPVALISLVDDRRQFFKSLVGLANLRETPLTHSFCQHVVTSGEPLLVSDARGDARVAGNLAISELGVVAYAGVPLLTDGAQALGALCVIDMEPHEWSQEDLEVLQELARSVMTEVSLKKAVRKLEEEAVQRERFVAILAHDLRQPLATIGLSAELIRRSPDREKREKHLTRIQGAGEFMRRLVEDLLDLARSRSSAMPISPRPMVFGAVVRKQVEGMRTAHPDRPFEVSSEGDDRGEWDPDRLSQVVANLLSNALQYGHPQAPIRVKTRFDAERAVLSVQNLNRGAPIAPPAQARLFEPFVRGSADGEARSNVGLGLFIVNQIARAHGGDVQVQSTAETGTTFTVQLPRRALG